MAIKQSTKEKKKKLQEKKEGKEECLFCEIDSKIKDKIRKRLRIIDFFIVAVFVIIIAFSIFGSDFLKTSVGKGIEGYGLTFIFIIIAFIELVPQLMNPYLAIAAGITAGFHFYLVLIVAIFATLAGSIIGFELGKRYGIKFICLFFEDKVISKVINFWNNHGRFFVFLSAVTPLPYLPFVFGALEMKREDFFVYGITARIIGFIAFGYIIRGFF